MKESIGLGESFKPWYRLTSNWTPGRDCINWMHWKGVASRGSSSMASADKSRSAILEYIFGMYQCHAAIVSCKVNLVYELLLQSINDFAGEGKSRGVISLRITCNNVIRKH